MTTDNSATQPLVSVVIVTRDRKEKLLRLLQTVFESDYPADRLAAIVVDNGSSDGTVQTVRLAFPAVRILEQGRNIFSAAGRNIGAAAAISAANTTADSDAAGGLVFLVDDDNILDRQCIRSLAGAFSSRSDLGVAGPLMLSHPETDTIWCAGGVMSALGMPRHLYGGAGRGTVEWPELIEAVDYFPNAYMVRAEVFRRGIWHDAENFPHNWNEQDFCSRVRHAGFALATVPAAVTWHDIGYRGQITRVGTDKTFDQARARILYRRLYLNRTGQWLFFWLVLLPLSTAYYFFEFIRRRPQAGEGSDPGFFALASSYFSGTYAGFCRKLRRPSGNNL